MESMEERRSAIVNFVNEKGNVTFNQLKEKFADVSEMTLRTDLKHLDEARRIIRVHGGAKSVDIVLGTDDLMGRRSARNVDAKAEIVNKTLELIRPNTTIFLDSGSTTTMLAERWPDQYNYIFTNSLTCALALSKLSKPKVFLSGGELNTFSLCTSSLEGLEYLKKVNFDTLIMGVTSYDEQFGFSCGVPMEAELKRQLLKQSERKIVLMDTSKIDKKSTFHVCNLSDVDIVVTEGKNSDEFVNDCAALGIELI